MIDVYNMWRFPTKFWDRNIVTLNLEQTNAFHLKIKNIIFNIINNIILILIIYSKIYNYFLNFAIAI